MTKSGAKSSKEDLSKEALSKEDLNEVIVDLDPSDENSNKTKRRLLLRRFWQSAYGLWSKTRGERRAWFLTALILILVLLNLAASYGMNIWNRAIFDALEKHDCQQGPVYRADLLPVAGGQRLLYDCAGLRPDDDAAALARVADPPSARPLAQERPLLPAQSGDAAITRIPNIASPTTCGSRPKPRSISAIGHDHRGPVGR